MSEKHKDLTDDKVRAAYFERRTAATIYDANNCTSIEEEVRLLVEKAYGGMTVDEMLAELEDECCLDQDCLTDFDASTGWEYPNDA